MLLSELIVRLQQMEKECLENDKLMYMTLPKVVCPFCSGQDRSCMKCAGYGSLSIKMFYDFYFDDEDYLNLSSEEF